jgi:DNA invertase Pin-like site-specific DNA recombinase
MTQEERECIRKRQREGIDAALKGSISFGRPKVQVNPEFIETYNRWRNKKIAAVQEMK